MHTRMCRTHSCSMLIIAGGQKVSLIHYSAGRGLRRLQQGRSIGYPAMIFMGHCSSFNIRRKLSECIRKLSKQRFHIIVTCCEPNALMHRLQQSKTAMHYISAVDATQLQFTHSGDQELSALSAGPLKETIHGAGLPSEGCLVKSDLMACATFIHGCAAPSNPGKDVSAADTTSLPTQQQPDEASGEWRSS